MKKLYIFALVAMLFAACTTDETQDVAVNFEAPDTITVSFEDSDDTRIQLNEAQKTVWTKGDLVSVFYKSNANRKWQYQGETGERTGELKQIAMGSATAAMDKVVVAYPYSKNYLLNLTTGDIEATLPATQHYLSDSYGLDGNLMVSSGYFTQFSLKTVCGWLKVQLTGNGEKVRSIKLKGNNGEQVAGLIYVDTTTAACTLASEMGAVGDDGDGVVGGTGGNLAFDGADVKEVTLDCGEGVTLSSEATAFYIALPPQTFEKGLTIEILATDGSAMTKSTSNSIVIERNAIQPMTEFEVDFPQPAPANNEIWYTSSDGAVVTPYKTDVFGANIVSNVYENGKGVITFDAPVTSIGDWAFNYCSSLTSVTIPDSVTEMGECVFKDCWNLQKFKGKFATTDGNAIITNDVFIAYSPYCSLTEYVIPNNVIRIATCAFRENEYLEKVVIPNSVVEIGEGVFSSSGNIKQFEGKFVIDNGRAIVVDNIFVAYANGCEIAEYTIPDGVTKIGWYAFDNSIHLEKVTIPETVTEVGNVSFAFCYSLQSVYCKPTTPPIAILDNFAGYGWEAFDWNFGTTIYVPAASVEEYKSADGWSKYADNIVGYDFEKGEVVQVQSNNEIWYTATEKVLPYKTDNFGANIVSNEWNETTGKGIITFDGEVTSIGGGAFAHCYALKSINIPNSIIKIDQEAFLFSGLETITIPDSVTSIGASAFQGCGSLTSVTIGNSVTEIGDAAFVDCTKLSSFNGKFASEDGRCLIIDGMLISFAPANISVYTIPDSVTSIGDCAFLRCRNLTTLTIHDNVTSIGEFAFQRCEGLSSLIIGNNVATIGYNSISSCTSLTSITIPNSVTTIGNEAFWGCSGLKSITIPDSVTSIGCAAFQDCSGLTTATIGANVPKLNGYTFQDCYSLKTVYCRATTPPYISEYGWDFQNNASERKFYVPGEAYSAYVSAWAQYKDDIVCPPEFIVDGVSKGFGVLIDNLYWAPVNTGSYVSHYAACTSMCPEGWRAPTLAELTSLAANKSSFNNGYYFSGSQPYSESVPRVWFPASGRVLWGEDADDEKYYYKGERGYYWSSESTGAYGARSLMFNSEYVTIENLNAFEYGCAIRCVKDAE